MGTHAPGVIGGHRERLLGAGTTFGASCFGPWALGCDGAPAGPHTLCARAVCQVQHRADASVKLRANNNHSVGVKVMGACVAVHGQ